VLRLIAIWVVVATSSSMFSVRNVLSNPTPRRAACHRSHSTPFELAFCQSGSPRTNAPKHPRTLTRHISDASAFAHHSSAPSPLWSLVSTSSRVVTLVRRGARHLAHTLFPSPRSFAVPIVTAVDCSRRHARALLESSRSCTTAVVTLLRLGSRRLSCQPLTPS